ncbi:DUF4279 domain-containing protein [Stutzerimonas nitrititolerans]|uniref:DUF4279 domain-containing protein n=1 Tax=Stutzerimonas nitrititolerans TaxID=2482751 RepID=UPI0015E45312|nr:DUF4279 domain-containing protein [Stutzerimonas nitrititolerans]MBA1186120.1 DUF4279 domain-containing protein [Stutzerimonas stutzeri]
MSIDFSSRLTPVDPNYPSCSECFSEFVLYTDDIDPHIVKVAMPVAESEVLVKGGKIKNSIGRERVIKNSIYFLSSDSRVASKDLRDHLDWVIERIFPFRERLLDFQRSGMRMGINCVWWSKGMGGPTLWPEQMEKFSAMNLECSFSFYMDEDM